MIIVKLGGSVITDKTGYKCFRELVVRRLASEIKNAGEGIILVHGAGSFGHVLADRYGLHLGFQDGGQKAGLAEVMADVRELNLKVMRVLNEEGVYCASIPPSAIAELDDGRLMDLDMRRFEGFSDLGITPVTFGDVCLDRTRGFSICSGDQLIESLARHFNPSRIIFCADVDGVCTSDPNLDEDAELIEVVSRETLESLPRTRRYVDVTGSIFGKIESMLQMASFTKECLVINGNLEGRLESALRGERVIGSRVVFEGSTTPP